MLLKGLVRLIHFKFLPRRFNNVLTHYDDHNQDECLRSA